MRICLVSETSISRDRRAIAEAESLRLAGHEVVGVSRDQRDEGWVRHPAKPGLLGRLTGESPPPLAELAAQLNPHLYQPTHPSGINTAAAASDSTSGSSVLVKPGWERPSHSDLIALAASQPERSVPSSETLPTMHIPDYRHPDPELGVTGAVVIAYRRTATNPGRYLEAALLRSGLEVRRVEEIDWDDIDPQTRGVVVVESPLPALSVRGRNPGVPVAFWVHHGEHHVDANTRLQRRYGAHAVLLAHSWHLTHRFLGLVERFPFGVARELFIDQFRPHEQRKWEVGFVGATSPERYGRREDLIARLRADLGEDRVRVASGVPPEEMAAIYAESKLVLDDAARRHYPITMRVFEATGAGAALLAHPAPGVELLLDPGTEFLPMAEDPVAQATRLLRHGVEEVARAGHRRVWSDHTYDIRVSELLTTFDQVHSSGIPAPEPHPPAAGLAALVDRFCDAQRVLDLGADLASDLPGREVWSFSGAAEKAEPNTFHLAVIADGDEYDQRRAVKAARLAVVTPPSEADRVAALVREAHGSFERHDFPEGVALTFGSSGYRLNNRPDPD